MERISEDRPIKQDKTSSEFLLKLKCYGASHNTWEREVDIDRKIILKYIRSEAWPGDLQKQCSYKRGKQKCTLFFPRIWQMVISRLLLFQFWADFWAEFYMK